MTAVFLETSALLRLVFQEPGDQEVKEQIDNAERIMASRLIRLEAERALLRFALDYPSHEGQLPEMERELKHLWPTIDFIEITADICDLAGRIAPRSRLRSLDAIHLATYHVLRGLEPAMVMLTFDQRIQSEL